MIRIFESGDELSAAIADEMLLHLRKDPRPVFCLASGSTPQASYAKFAALAKEEPRLSQLRIVSLDEWVGIERTSEGSCYGMLDADLFSRLPIDPGAIAFFDGTSADLQRECERIDSCIAHGPITFSLMGIGMNGHIGLNEPGLPVLDRSSVVRLSSTTREVAQKYFDHPTELDFGITLGLGQIAASKRVVVAAVGRKKASIVRTILTRPEADLPAQKLLGHSHIDFYLDAEAASELEANVTE
ncbi:6-phosphogluconolactonase [Paenibacillus sp. LHD-117]|uniref:6-phosphogluconolactonase n=1 Tax=Paenibacillus sp. LHD-117 TaxID=3071412 RepID=UPI0027E0A84E|nr:6-phosphogluconolactonase [Paenibacillus sp. LHD-117]MDQ6421473.1 6-phosphogluconolactonase [Paenibacillus sp. LHD-117]